MNTVAVWLYQIWFDGSLIVGIIILNPMGTCKFVKAFSWDFLFSQSLEIRLQKVLVSGILWDRIKV